MTQIDKRLMEQWEQYVQETAAAFAYPPAPDLAGDVARRLQQRPTRSQGRPLPSRQRLAWAAALLLLLLAGLMAVPQVRAAVLQVLRVGAVTIFITEPVPTPAASPTAVPATLLPGLASAIPATVLPHSAPMPATLIDSLHTLAGATTLAEAQAQGDFPLRLPTYPPQLGLPDRVFRQEQPHPVLVFLWLEPGQAQKVKLALYLIEGDEAVLKKEVQLAQETTVNGNWAVWVQGEHLLQLQDGRFQPWYFVEGNVLIWFDGHITYRLESGLPLAEAVQIAESLETIPVFEELP